MKLKPKHKRDQMMVFRLTAAERKVVESAAGKSRSVSDWIRDVILMQAAQVPKESALKALEGV